MTTRAPRTNSAPRFDPGRNTAVVNRSLTASSFVVLEVGVGVGVEV